MSEPKRMTEGRLTILRLPGAGPWRPEVEKEVLVELDRARASEAEKDKALEEQREVIKALMDACETYFEYHGAQHEEDDCPEDDTCQCPRLVALNTALAKAGALP